MNLFNMLPTASHTYVTIYLVCIIAVTIACIVWQIKKDKKERF